MTVRHAQLNNRLDSCQFDQHKLNFSVKYVDITQTHLCQNQPVFFPVDTHVIECLVPYPQKGGIQSQFSQLIVVA